MKPDGTKSRGHGDKKPRKVDQFIAAVLAHRSVEAAADSIKIGKTTAWRWLKDPAVVEKIRVARREALDRAMARLQEAATQAVDTLCEVQTKGESESARVTAARVILEMALHSVELGNVQQRLDALEALAKTGNWKGSSHDGENQAATRQAGRINGHG